jgi:hypothetical protein
MAWHYSFTPYAWPLLVSAGILIGLILYSLRKRKTPGAGLFAIWLAFTLLWIAANVMELLAVGMDTRSRSKSKYLSEKNIVLSGWLLPVSPATTNQTVFFIKPIKQVYNIVIANIVLFISIYNGKT